MWATKASLLWPSDHSVSGDPEGTGEVTVVTIEHRGWEQFGAGGPDLRERNRQGWTDVFSHYEAACAAPPGS
jgi:hypothetical protein